MEGKGLQFVDLGSSCALHIADPAERLKNLDKGAAIDALRNGGYKGYYSFEWEKLWHPEIGASDVVIAEYVRVMKARSVIRGRTDNMAKA